MKRNSILYFYLSLVLVCVLIAVCTLLYRAGYRLGTSGLVHVGSIEVSAYQSGSNIYIDSILKDTTTSNNEKILFKNIDPGTHSVIVSKDGFWPWKKDVSVEQNQTTELSSFTLPEGVLTSNIPKTSDEYTKANVIIENNILPNKDHQKISADGTTGLWVENNSIFTSTAEVTHLADTIHNVAFYKDRNDLIIFSTDSGVYVIETDKRGTQNFQPLVTGPATFGESDENTVYVKENEAIVKIIL